MMAGAAAGRAHAGAGGWVETRQAYQPATRFRAVAAAHGAGEC